MEAALQFFFYFRFIERLVAMRSQKAATGGEDGALTIALNGAAFEHEVEMVFVL